MQGAQEITSVQCQAYAVKNATMGVATAIQRTALNHVRRRIARILPCRVIQNIASRHALGIAAWNAPEMQLGPVNRIALGLAGTHSVTRRSAYKRQIVETLHVHCSAQATWMTANRRAHMESANLNVMQENASQNATVGSACTRGILKRIPIMSVTKLTHYRSNASKKDVDGPTVRLTALMAFLDL